MTCAWYLSSRQQLRCLHRQAGRLARQGEAPSSEHCMLKKCIPRHHLHGLLSQWIRELAYSSEHPKLSRCPNSLLWTTGFIIWHCASPIINRYDYLQLQITSRLVVSVALVAGSLPGEALEPRRAASHDILLLRRPVTDPTRGYLLLTRR
ncbi:hypothetical protein J6590_091516 [Homalodisca vitripennis]|nr:hypothetical protein J6590_091516 [Homalodisca vitripennis]